MGDGAGRQAELTGELVEWWEDLWQRGMTSRVVLVAVPPGWGRSTALDRLAEAVSADGAQVTLTVKISGRELADEDVGVQAAGLQDCLAGARTRHRVAELLGLDRFGGAAQVGLGVGGLFISGLAAGVGFLVAGAVMGAAGKAWDDSPAGQDGAVARAARAVAAESAEVPVVVIIDDADWLDQDLALTMIENLAARHNGHVLVVAAVNPGGGLVKALVSRSRQGITEGLVHVADADPDMGYESRADLLREQCPALPEAVVRRIARRTSTFADVYAVAAAPWLAEINAGPAGINAGPAGINADQAGINAGTAEFDADMVEFEAMEVTEAVLRAQLKRPAPSPEAVIIAWAGGVLHARQVARALPILGAGAGPEPPADADPDPDVLRWNGLERLADRRAPRLSVQVAALVARDRRAMAAAVLDEALRIAADPECGLVDRIAAARAAHRVRADLADRSRLARVQRELAADLETLGEPADALEVAAAALQEWPNGGRPDDRDWLAAAVLRLANAKVPPARLPTQLAPLLSDLITEAVAGGAAVGPEARIWAAIDLLAIDGQREVALALIDQVTVLLDQRPDFGAVGDRWRLLLAFHAGRAGYPAIAAQLLAPLLNSADPAQQDDARAVLHAGAGPGADTRLQNIVLEAELAALPPDADDDRIRVHHALAGNHETLGDFRQALIHAQLEVEIRRGIQSPDHPDVLMGRHCVAFWTGICGDAAGALRMSLELLPDRQRVFGPDHHLTLDTRYNIAFWTSRSGDPAEALRLAQEVLTDRERVLGPDHPGTLTTRNNIANLTGATGDRAEAIRLLLDLLPDLERVLGPGHPDTMTTRNDIASLADQPKPDGPEPDQPEPDQPEPDQPEPDQPEAVRTHLDATEPDRPTPPDPVVSASSQSPPLALLYCHNIDETAPLAPAPRPPCQLRQRPQTPPVAYASDRKRHLSPTPPTPIGAVDGVGDRSANLSMA